MPTHHQSMNPLGAPFFRQIVNLIDFTKIQAAYASKLCGFFLTLIYFFLKVSLSKIRERSIILCPAARPK